MVRTFPFVLGLFVIGCSGTSVEQDTTTPPQPDELSRSLLDVEQRIVRDPKDASLYAERARLYRSADSSRQAINDWIRALSIDSTNASYHAELGDLYYTKLMVDLARERFEKAMELDPEAVSPKLKMAEVELVLRNYGSALDLVNAALRIDPNLAEAYYLKGWTFKEAGDTALAISSYRTAVEQDPDHYNAFIQLGLLHAAQHDDLAIQYYRSALEIRPQSVEANYNLGIFAQDHGLDSLAISCYERITAIDPGNAAAPYNTGWIHLKRLKEFRKAEQYFTQALDLNTNYYQAWYNRGLAMEQLGKLDSAAADMQVALLIRPDFDLAAEALGRLYDKGAYVKEFERDR
ncbi:MAG: tetratricopeptide repeat protein [Flavobacteriales bacterium]|nr:tetratricopeptide repeat protein [Flavobacteriales bacterium]